MGLDFYILNEETEAVECYAIKWLYHYDPVIIRELKTVPQTMLYCRKQIEVLLEKQNNFMKRKQSIITGINEMKNDKELKDMLKDLKMDMYGEDDDTFDELDGLNLKRFRLFLMFLEENSAFHHCAVEW